MNVATNHLQNWPCFAKLSPLNFNFASEFKRATVPMGSLSR